MHPTRRTVLATFLAAPVATAARAAPRRTAALLVAAARRQVGVTTGYDRGYSVLRYPGGDVPRDRGVCTDVVIRAYRDAFGLDLQALVHADMARGFAAYPHRWGLKRPDANIDHRRVPNLHVFLTRQGARLPLPGDPNGWRPGDLYTCLIRGTIPHIGIVSDRRPGGRPGCVIENVGAGVHEQVALFDYTLTGRFRWMLEG
jgi:uncharacterized protein YijF (DUF1287 family)